MLLCCARRRADVSSVKGAYGCTAKCHPMIVGGFQAAACAVFFWEWAGYKSIIEQPNATP
jgi:hypothetical protein